jgi:hypothetical protein
MKANIVRLLLLVANLFTASARAQEKLAPAPAIAATARAAQLLADIKTFTLRLSYYGQQDKPYYHLLLSVAPLRRNASDNPFHRQAQITEAQAAKIVEFLSGDGFMAVALDGNRNLGPVPPKEPYYSLTVSVSNGGNPIVFEEWLTFRPLLFQRLDGLRKLLDGDAATGMDFLLTRLSGHRREMTQ